MSDLLPLEPHCEGPTWRRTSTGGWFLPEKTLGWGIINWLAQYVRSPDGEGPFLPTLEQARFLLWFYALNDEGKFQYRSCTLRRMKGAGKDPLAAAMAITELCGPVAFSHWDAKGEPVGKPKFAAWVQLAAVTQEQTKNTRALFPALITDKLKKDFKLEVLKSIIYSGAGGRIESITSSPYAAEGNRPTFVVLNEAMELSTPIPTPSGWTTMGALRAGDVIFGSTGQPTTVIKAHPVQVGRDCYRVTFVDGTSVVTSDGHLWLTKIPGSNAKPRIRSTRDMFEHTPPASGPFSKQVVPKKYAIPRAGVRETPPADLPVDPYLLGVWLGDGSTGECNITAGVDDVVALQAELAKRGVETRLLKSTRDTVKRISFSSMSGYQGANRPPVAIAMRELPCYRDKHIPSEYLTAGTEQRLELLRGLMDTDGCASNTKDGRAATRCIFIGRKQLAHDVLELVRSLGQIAYISFVEDSRSRDGGYYRVEFQAWRIQPFSMPRKANAVKLSKRDWTTIKSIEPVDSVPVRCIAVDADDHLFQAGESGFVTHNTQFWFDTNNGHELAEVVRGNITKTNGRVLSICNAHVPGEDSIAERDYDAYQLVKSGQAVDTGILYDSLEAPPGTPISEIPAKDVDPQGYEQGLKKLAEGIRVARGDAVWLDVDAVISSILDVRTPISESRRKFLNQLVASEDSFVSAQEWDACAVMSEGLALKPRDKITLAFDGSKTNDWSALCACRVEDGYLQVLKVWDPKRQPGGEINREDVDAAVRSAFATYDVVGFRADVYGFESYVDQWSRDFKRTLKINACVGNVVAYDMRGQTKKFALDCERFLDAVLACEVMHGGDPTLRRHMLNARRHPLNSGLLSIRKESRDSQRKIDAAVTAVMAYGQRHDYLMSKHGSRTGKALIIP